MTTVRLYSGRDIIALSNPLAMIAAVEMAILADDLIVPDRLHIDNGHTTLLVMPAGSNRSSLVKCVSVASTNPANGLPLVQGVALLNDAITGTPLAIFDATQLTGLRTGAIAGIAVRALSDPNLNCLGVVGAGEQARWIAIHAAAVRPVSEIVCLTRTEASFMRFCEALAPVLPHVHLRRVADATQLLASASCIVTATTSNTPVLPDVEALLHGKTLISIGSFARHAQELPDSAYRLARSVIVDSPHAVREVGDLIGPIERGVIAHADIVPIAALLAGTHRPLNATRVFKSVGYAAFDLFAAIDLHRRGSARGKSQEINL